jgi:hypothetical protein
MPLSQAIIMTAFGSRLRETCLGNEQIATRDKRRFAPPPFAFRERQLSGRHDQASTNDGITF